MRVLLFGATGMVGQGVLRECLLDPRVAGVTAIGRRKTGKTHEKLTEIVHEDFEDYSAIQERLAGHDACFFCLGVSAAGMSKASYTRITEGYTLAAARALLAENPDLVFVYVSGAGTDSSERGRWMWARVKGRTENTLARLGFARFYAFRPAFIQPLDGIRSGTALYRAAYAVSGLVLPALRSRLPKYVTTTRNVGRAMIEIALSRPDEVVFENDAIEAWAKKHPDAKEVSA